MDIYAFSLPHKTSFNWKTQVIFPEVHNMFKKTKSLMQYLISSYTLLIEVTFYKNQGAD